MSDQLCPHNIYIGIDCKKCSANPRIRKLEKEIKKLQEDLIKSKDDYINLHWQLNEERMGK